MADLLLQQVFLNEINQDQSNDGKYEIKAQVILPDKIHLECRLYEMREILDRYRSQTGEKPDKNAEQIDELLVAEVFIPPPEELFPQFFNLGHAIGIRIIPDLFDGSRRLKLRIIIKGKKTR
jgi:hypothetical protein